MTKSFTTLHFENAMNSLELMLWWTNEKEFIIFEIKLND